MSVSSLYDLCLFNISNKIEKYPPEAFACLSETQWEEIIKFRHKNTTPTNQSSSCSYSSAELMNLGWLDSTGRKSPAIRDKVIAEIEQLNEHLSGSKVTDDLIWKDCVNYSFKFGAFRPKVLYYPWSILVERVTTSGSHLMSLLNPPNKCESMDNLLKERRQMLIDSLSTLTNSYMCTELLNQTKIGKTVVKFIKRSKKISGNTPDYVVDLWTKSIRPEMLHHNQYHQSSSTSTNQSPLISALGQLELLLQSWMKIAEEEGVEVSNTSSTSNLSDVITNEMSGKSKGTSEEQYELDLMVIQKCNSWRELFEALTERKQYVLKSHGKKQRDARQKVEQKKNTVKKVQTVQKIAGLRLKSSFGKSASTSGKTSKIGSWKHDAQVLKATQRGLPKPPKKGSAFGNAVASAVNKRKKTSPLAGRNDKMITTSQGKRMRMPTRDKDNNFASNQLRRKAFGNKY